MKKMIFAAAIAQEKRNDMPTQGMNTLARERDYQAISERLSQNTPKKRRKKKSLGADFCNHTVNRTSRSKICPSGQEEGLPFR